jgi:hypothetical protein
MVREIRFARALTVEPMFHTVQNQTWFVNFYCAIARAHLLVDSLSRRRGTQTRGMGRTGAGGTGEGHPKRQSGTQRPLPHGA